VREIVEKKTDRRRPRSHRNSRRVGSASPSLTTGEEDGLRSEVPVLPGIVGTGGFQGRDVRLTPQNVGRAPPSLSGSSGPTRGESCRTKVLTARSAFNGAPSVVLRHSCAVLFGRYRSSGGAAAGSGADMPGSGSTGTDSGSGGCVPPVL